jgi:hypothetical protein
MRGCAALATAAALAGILTACGSAPGKASLTTARRTEQSGPVAGSRALAQASARRLLGLLVLPAGSRPFTARKLPQGIDQPGESFGGPGVFLDVDRLYRLPMTMTAALTFLSAHRPRGTVPSNASGESADGATVLSKAVAVTQPRVPPGIEGIHLVTTVAPGPGGTSLLRADAQVTWYPPRSRAEHLIAARFRLVRITMSRLTGTATSVQGGQRLIRPLVTLINSLQATPPILAPCPSGTADYELVFEPAVPAQAAVTISSGGCGVDSVSVGRRPQPDLVGSAALTGLVSRFFREYSRRP